MQKVVGYLRISRRGQEKGYGRELQLKAIQELCKSKGYELTATYIDSAISGTEKGFESREAYHRMVLDCQEKKIKKISSYNQPQYSLDVSGI